MVAPPPENDGLDQKGADFVPINDDVAARPGARGMPILETERLLLRTWVLEDAEEAFGFYADPEVMRFLGDGKPFADVEVVRERIALRTAHQEQHGYSLWAAVEKETGRLVGACGLYRLEGGPEVEVGYHLARAVWGKGYATEGASACLQYGFQRVGLERIVGVVDPNNHASRRVLEKIGLRFEKMARHYNRDVRYFAATRLDHSGALSHGS
jgi:RimJ/RimL family protein N-acetyltransferase